MPTMQSTIEKLLAMPKGILAADESLRSIEKRFAEISLESTAENRMAYREMLMTTPNLSDYISGVILFDEQFRGVIDGQPMSQYLLAQDIVPIIKVDTGTKSLADESQEYITSGLEGLADRLREYAGLGALAAKWRSVFIIGDGLPSDVLIKRNAQDLAEYAYQCQQHNIVPIVEPEILMQGNHSIVKGAEVCRAVLQAVFVALEERGVAIEQILLKTNFVTSGVVGGQKVTSEEVAHMTYEVFTASVPEAVPGIVFLSGGIASEVATEYLNAIVTLGESLPWALSFSYGRALQYPALEIWNGNHDNIEAAQEALLHRAHMNALARQGVYTNSEE